MWLSEMFMGLCVVAVGGLELHCRGSGAPVTPLRENLFCTHLPHCTTETKTSIKVTPAAHPPTWK